MRKRTLVVGVLFILAAAWCMNAYAADSQCPIGGFFESIGGFLYNALPWNWGCWMK